MHGKRALSATVRGLLCGVAGGCVAGALDAILSASSAAQFLPDGSGRLGVFLLGLYAAFAGVGGAAIGLLAFFVGSTTDLGRLWASAFADGTAEGREARIDAVPDDGAGAPIAIFALGLVAGGVLLGALLRVVVFAALSRFHSPLLISAFVGGVGGALAIVAFLVAFLVAGLLSPLARGRRARRLAQEVRVPAGILASAWVLGLGAGALGVFRLLAALQQNRRMSSPLRALNAAIWSPPILIAALLAAHLLASRLGPRRRARSDGGGGLLAFAASPLGAIALPVVLIGAGLSLVAAAEWSIVKLLPIRPALIVAAAVLAALVCAAGSARLLPRRALAQAALFVLPAIALATALQAGRADRVLKAAVTHAALAAPLLDAIHAGWDLDRDGYSPLLGPDCNDWSADVHPGALDWPDDGIDQNCNGHQATLAHDPRPPFFPLDDSVPRAPNIVLISIDALRADHVGAYGYGRPTTPRIDELSRDAVVFDNGWAHSPSTRYSVPAILIGRYESTIAWGPASRHWPPEVLPENRLIPEMLKEHGYHTGALVPAHYFEPTWGLTQGFDDYDNSLARLHGNVGGDPARATGSSSRELADLGVRWIDDAAKRTSPFFLWMHFYDPHYLYDRHPEVPSFGDRDIDLYDGEVRYTDLHVGRVLDELRKSGAWDHTIVIVTADHGEGFGEHGVSQHGYHIYAQQNKVPFIVHVPGIAPRRVTEPVGHVDIFPSLLNILRAPDEPQLLGRSFLDLMLGQGGPRLVYQEVDFEGPTSRKAVASRTAQLIGNVVPDGTFEFYDLAHDPDEAHDLFVRGAGGEQRRLEAALGAWADEVALPRDFAERVSANLSSSPFPSERALSAQIGGWLSIDGVSVPTRNLHPGEPAEVDLVLHATAPPPTGFRLFTHLRAAGGPLLQNLDHEPVEGFVPLARLRPGQWVRDRIHFQIPPGATGTLSVEVGLWKNPSRAKVVGQRAEDGVGVDGDLVRVANITVHPAEAAPAPPSAGPTPGAIRLEDRAAPRAAPR